MFPQYQLSPCHRQVGTTDCGVFAIVHSIDVLFGNNPSEIVHEQSKLRQHLVDCFEKGILTTFPKYKCNVKYNDTTTRRSISSEDQYKSLIPRLSACLKKRLANTNPTEMKNKFSPLINNSPTTVNAIRNLNDSKNHHGQPNIFMIQSYSTYQENNFRHLKNRFWKRVLNFCPETPGYNKLKLTVNLFCFCKNLRLREFFHDDIGTATNNNNLVCNKTQERTDMSKQLKNRSFHPPQDHCDKPIYFINKKRNYQLKQQEVHQ